MNVENKLTVVVEVTDAEQANSLREFLGNYTSDLSREAMASYERKRGDDLEGEADKLRAQLSRAAIAMAGRENGSLQAADMVVCIGQCTAAIDAYDNSTHKAIPF